VRSRSIGGNIAAGLKSLGGGEIGAYVKLNFQEEKEIYNRGKWRIRSRLELYY